MKDFRKLIPHLQALRTVQLPEDQYSFDEERMQSVEFQLEMLPWAPIAQELKRLPGSNYTITYRCLSTRWDNHAEFVFEEELIELPLNQAL